ncbi:MAG: glycosyltransferase family 39 protein [Anaerolineae bacterium]|nr:glycosyltransferase family 39 protein [Anaerolineae bacterium]
MRRAYGMVGALALLWGAILAIAIRQPGYTDAYYYFNAGQRWVEGDDLTDPYLWVYINAPDELPGPSHVYWMPLESLVTAASMAVGGAHFGAAQVPSVLCFAGLVALAFWLGARLGGDRRRAWLAALLVMFSGFYTPFWTTTDTFALYGLVGALALVTMGLGRESGDWRWYALSGACGGLAHLTRADGLLLVMVLVWVAFWPGGGIGWTRRGRLALAGVVAYLLIMAPWFVRNMAEIDTPLPTGGMDTIWLRGYDELVNYPPGASMSDFFDWGLDNIVRSRLAALGTNLGTFIAVETWVILGPFVLLGLWQRRCDPFLAGVIWYAMGLHAAMTFVFAYPGYRGGLLHSSAALLPFFAATGVIGLDAGIAWMAQRRRWPRRQAQAVFSSALIVLVVLLSVGVLVTRLPDWNDNGTFYKTLAADLPPDVVVMVNDPAALYYHTGLAGVVVPNADPAVVPEIAARYGVTHLVLDVNRPDPFTGLFLEQDKRPFLRLVRLYDADTADPADDYRLFEILLPE